MCSEGWGMEAYEVGAGAGGMHSEDWRLGACAVRAGAGAMHSEGWGHAQ